MIYILQSDWKKTKQQQQQQQQQQTIKHHPKVIRTYALHELAFQENGGKRAE